MPQCNYGAATHVGLLRSNNEDEILCKPELGLWLVADGMGGHEAGEVASHLAQHAIQEAVSNNLTLDQAVYNAHLRILAAVDQGEGKFGMGSTVVALRSTGNQYQIAWVGDSRAYLYSPSNDGSLKQLSTDHSYVQSLFDSGAITKAEMSVHPDKNIITQCLGSTELESIQVDYLGNAWHKNERLVLCSDGLSDGVGEAQIITILKQNPNAQNAADALIQAALACGGKDNVSVIVVHSPENLASPWHAWFKALFSKG